MRGRSPQEAHRAATPLELFFDLVFVVAIAQAGSGLHHAIAEQHVAEGVIRYAMVFFAIWWAWMNFTWFASAYDCDDVAYRLAVFTQMTGALILTAGIPAMFAEQDFTLGVLGYVVMRLAMVAQWLRAARGDRAHRPAARRYALGIGLVQVAWVLLLLLPGAYWLPLFGVLCGIELLIPAWAERPGMTPWHPHHIAERYGLMTIIVLGESVLAATLATEEALASGRALAQLAPLIAGGLLIVYSLWWLYFYRPAHDLLTSLGRAIAWGYGHYVVFAAAAAVGAGLAVALDHDIGKAAITDRTAGAAVAIPVALYLGSLWLLHGRGLGSAVRVSGPVSIGLVLLTPFTPQPVMLTGVILVLLLAVKLRAQAATPSS
jgi:low temperature requirement protein LtrA